MRGRRAQRRRVRRSHGPPLAQADDSALGDDDVIEQSDAEKLADLCQPARDGDVLLAWLRVATRMVVRDDDARSRHEHGRAENLPRVDDARVERPDAYGL